MAGTHSKLPDLKEIGSMASKFFSDLKKSACEIMKEYQDKRQTETQAKVHEEPAEKKSAAEPKTEGTRAKTTSASKKKTVSKKEA